MRSSRHRVAAWRGLLIPTGLVVVVVLAAGPAISVISEEQPKTAFRDLQLGYLALEDGNFESAMEHYSRARDRATGEEQRFNALFGLGSAALELGRLDLAREVFEQAHQLKPDEVGATFMLGLTCRHQGDLDDAVKYLAEAAVRDPDFTQSLVELAIAYGAIERHADAERVCREVLAKKPENFDARLGLAVALFHQAENEAAVSEFREALGLKPDSIRAHYGLGLALVFAGDSAGAIEEMDYLHSRAPELSADLQKWIYPDGS